MDTRNIKVRVWIGSYFDIDFRCHSFCVRLDDTDEAYLTFEHNTMITHKLTIESSILHELCDFREIYWVQARNMKIAPFLESDICKRDSELSAYNYPSRLVISVVSLIVVEDLLRWSGKCASIRKISLNRSLWVTAHETYIPLTVSWQ